MFLAGNLSDVRNVLPGGGEINDVVQLDCVVTSWDDGFVSTLDGHNVERNVS
jgi:hypothetical protein